MLGVDQEVIARGIEMKYKELGAKQDIDNQQHFTIEGVRYLEKIIQLPFQIPPVEQADMGDFVDRLSAEWPHEECPKIFAEGLGDNPRQIKRTVNTFLMLWKLADKRKAKLQGRIKPIRLAKVVAIQAVYPELYNLLLKEEPRYLKELEDYFRAASKEAKAYEDEQERQVTKPVEPPPALVPFLSRRGAGAVQRILMYQPKLSGQGANFAGLSPDQLKLYFTLTRRVESPQGAAFGIPLVFSEPQMIRIPEGKFLMGTTLEQAQQIVNESSRNSYEWKKWVEWEKPQHEVELSEYFISKYPVTNREYQVFVRDAKHTPPRG